MNKRLISLLLAALMLITLTACRSKKQETAQVSETYVIPAAETEFPPPSPTDNHVPGVASLDEPLDDFVGQIDDNADDSNNISEPQSTSVPTDSTNNADNNGEPQSSPAPTKTPSEPDAPEEPDVTPAPAEDMTEYEAYNAMSAEEQMAFYETFDSMADFVAWYNSVQAEHEATHGAIEVGDGNIDLSEIIHGQP